MKIFFNDRYIELLKPGESFEGQVVIPGSKAELIRLIGSFEMDLSRSILGISAMDYRQLKSDVKTQFTYLKAAGGMVKNERGEILFIFRRGKWDLPKGRIEEKDQGSGIKDQGSRMRFPGDLRLKNMHRIAAALREVEEETGLMGAEVVGELRPTWHVYYADRKRILKKTWWFEMVASGDKPLVPQTEEDILFARWFRREELEVVLGNTYGSLREMVLSAINTQEPKPHVRSKLRNSGGAKRNQ